MTDFGFPEPINVASTEFALIVIAVLVVNWVLGRRALPYALGLSGLFMAATWLDTSDSLVLAAALIPHFFVTRTIWGRPEKIGRTGLVLSIGWQVLVLTSTKITGVSDGWGIYGVIGLSYMTFRQIHLLMEAPRVKSPFRAIDWLSYIINPLTLVAGPIQTWTEHTSQFTQDASKRPFDIVPAGHLIATGLIKITILAPIFAGQDDFANLIGSDVDRMDWAISYFSYYIFLYLDFSGYVDVVLGCGILCGYRLPANFNRPYLASNFQDFWGRWHITLGTWFRAHVFTPTLVALQRSGRFANPDHAIVLALILIFLLIGVWHGIAWNFALFGVIHAVGVAINHLYGRWKTKRDKARKRPKPSGVSAQLWKVGKIVAFQTLVAGTFILLNNDVSDVWRAIFGG